MKISKFISTLVAVAATLCVIPAEAAQTTRAPSDNLHGQMRKLWDAHVALTREYLLKAAANQP
ncbi:MAG TPA: hypothetical protein VF751_11055, partial [Chthoniobacterales bacterium]